jgi:peptidoglycan/xylan/chitin deacetylase (PgdA/CDA1 family)
MTSLGKIKSAGRQVVAKAGSEVLSQLPLRVWKKLFPKDAVGLCYHMVSDVPLPHLKHYPALTAQEFEADLAYAEENFGFLPYDELVRRRHSGGTTPRDNRAIITFDDGFAQCALVAAPILKRRGTGAIFFLVTDLIDNKILFRESAASLCVERVLRRPVEQVEEMVKELKIVLRPPPKKSSFHSAWIPLDVAGLDRSSDPRLRPLLHWLLTLPPEDVPLLEQICARLELDTRSYAEKAKPYLTSEQVRRLAADGFTLGAHSLSHRRLQTLSREEAEREIVESCHRVAAITGQKSVPFAFPYLGAGLDRAWLGELRARHGVIGLFFDSDGLREDAPHVVQRTFSERLGRDRNLENILRRAWARPSAWRPAT